MTDLFSLVNKKQRKIAFEELDILCKLFYLQHNEGTKADINYAFDNYQRTLDLFYKLGILTESEHKNNEITYKERVK